MKVKIETEAAARLFGCAIGEYRDLQRPDTDALIKSGDVSDAEAGPAKQTKSPRKPKGK